jgi:hypothetical protein
MIAITNIMKSKLASSGLIQKMHKIYEMLMMKNICVSSILNNFTEIWKKNYNKVVYWAGSPPHLRAHHDPRAAAETRRPGRQSRRTSDTRLTPKPNQGAATPHEAAYVTFIPV